MDKFYAEEAEKEYAKRQAKWDAEARARAALMDEVSATRTAQMADRGRQAEIERQRDEAQLEAWRAAQAVADAKTAEKLAQQKDRSRMQAVYNRQQLEENALARERAKQEEYLEW